MVKSKIRLRHYFQTACFMLLLLLMAIGVFLDPAMQFKHKLVIIFPCLGLAWLFYFFFKKLPQLSITKDAVTIKYGNKSNSILLNNIEIIQPFNPVPFFSFKRLGHCIQSKEKSLVIPYYIYSNQREILQLLEEDSTTSEKPLINFNITYIKYMSCIFKSLMLVFLIVILILFIAIGILKSNMIILSYVLISPIFFILLYGILKIGNRIESHHNQLHIFNPMLFRRKTIQICDIRELKYELYSTGRGMRKALNIMLKDYTLIDASAELNSEKELIEIEKTINETQN